MWDLGDTVPLTTEITGADGELISATGVVCTIALPDGTTATPAVANPSVGRYTVNYVPTIPGRHAERWTSTSPATARSDIFDVRTADPGYIVSLADAKVHLNLAAASTRDDEELRAFIEACTGVVTNLTGEAVSRRVVVETRTFDRCTYRFALHTIPVISLTAVTDLNGSTTWDVARLHVNTTTGVVSTLDGGSPLHGLVQLTYLAGYQVVPAVYTRAALMVLRHLWSTQRASLSLGGPRRTQLGGMEDNTMMIGGYSVPRAAVELIGPPTVGIA